MMVRTESCWPRGLSALPRGSMLGVMAAYEARLVEGCNNTLFATPYGNYADTCRVKAWTWSDVEYRHKGGRSRPVDCVARLHD